MICDWCFRKNPGNLLSAEAEFIAVTGTISDMKICDWVICGTHADILRAKHDNSSLHIAGQILVDVWDIRRITQTVKRYYKWGE